MAWKSAQYYRAWKSHRMTLPANLDLYRQLHRLGLFQVFSVSAGGRLLGGKIGLRQDGRSFWRITVYDPELGRYSPGSIVEMLTLKACFEAGDTDFDYLMGPEPYKFTFATHVRWVGNVGHEPRLDRWQRLGRMRVARVATRSPALYRRLKGVERQALRLRRRLSRG
jgi:CelD/BcsL family acetyltransferase involved in cellulose biosynthesis